MLHPVFSIINICKKYLKSEFFIPACKLSWISQSEFYRNFLSESDKNMRTFFPIGFWLEFLIRFRWEFSTWLFVICFRPCLSCKTISYLLLIRNICNIIHRMAHIFYVFNISYFVWYRFPKHHTTLRHRCISWILWTGIKESQIKANEINFYI